MANGSYSWITYLQARQQLAARLADSSMQFWEDAELGFYIQQALRIFNSLTFTWRKDFQFNSTSLWNYLGSLSGSPRLRTITDIYCYQELEYMLLEPPMGGIWTGTTQFSLADVSDALEGTRDDIIQITNCNQVLTTAIALTPNTIRTELPDNVIDVERVRYQPLQTTKTGTATSGSSTITVSSTSGIAQGQLVTGTNIAYPTVVSSVGTGSIVISQPTIGAVSGTLQFFTCTTLFRDDTVAQEFYEVPLYQQNAGTPNTFSLSSEPPLSWQVDIPPNQAGTYEALVLQSGTAFSPPTATLLGIPDDFAWVAEWGALAELLGRESEATDRERADYCQKMYDNGMELMQKTPWIELGKVNGQAVSIDSIYAMDRYSAEWDSDPNGFGPVIVAGGIDTIACPVGSGIGVTVLGNAPVPSLDTDYVQVSRSNWDTVLDLAQARASFKMAGAEWKAALELEQRAIQSCLAENSRIRSQGMFSDVLIQRGQQQERDMRRYNKRGSKDDSLG